MLALHTSEVAEKLNETMSIADPEKIWLKWNRAWIWDVGCSFEVILVHV